MGRPGASRTGSTRFASPQGTSMQCGLQGSDGYDPDPSGVLGVVGAIETVSARARRVPRPSNRRRGQSLVEFALVVPILIAIVAGTVQLALAFAAKNAL